MIACCIYATVTETESFERGSEFLVSCESNFSRKRWVPRISGELDLLIRREAGHDVSAELEVSWQRFVRASLEGFK